MVSFEICIDIAISSFFKR